MPAVSDSSPLILYAGIDRLNLLHEVFGDVFVPTAVWDEVVTAGADRRGVAIARMPWIHCRALALRSFAGTLLGELGLGEAEAISLAMELSGPVPILLDDRKGRRFARDFGLPLIGSAGVLVLAKDRGLIPAVRPLLGQLRGSGLYLSDAATVELLTLAGE